LVLDTGWGGKKETRAKGHVPTPGRDGGYKAKIKKKHGGQGTTFTKLKTTDKKRRIESLGPGASVGTHKQKE